ncbi:MAG: thiamine phosphate synthase [Gemmatimonadaceae bacterium]
MTSSADTSVWHVPVVHAITNDDKLLGPDFPAHAGDVMRALGARGAIHVRARWLPDRRLLDITHSLLAAARASGCLLVVNDRVDIALAGGADAVQLTSQSAGVGDVREMAPALRIGSSVHTPAEARDAGLFGADWCVAGHVFGSGSHADEPGRGMGFLRDCAEASDVPVIAIGGVSAGRVRDVIEAGAYGVASISGIWDAPNPGEAAGRYLSEYVAAAERRG